ncbi:FtsX-like permease family protein [uncultured Modestobacter sp.]|uniref:FtsX-like permease family protein n=1 Tax=uncultured Modestobacter sp. TaxID=380048 RepID=UPI00262307CD|nr:FtsX-like permease family protein [uncultured Modestobacter sp.]
MTATVQDGGADTRTMRRSTLLWLATVGGRADRTRIALTTVGAAAGVLALLAAATVASTGTDDGPYTSELLNEPGLHVGVVIALVLLCVPVLAFTGQCARIGAPARDRRLAALRLSGATPADVARVAATETGLAAALGAVLGLAVYLVGRVLLDTPVTATYGRHTELGAGSYLLEEVTGPVRRLPTDVLPPVWLIALLVAVVPAAAAVFALAALRRVATTPFGVVRRQQVRPVQVLPAALFAAGTLGMALFAGLARVTGLDEARPAIITVVFLALFLCTGVGLVLGTAAMSARAGEFLARRTGRPALLIAARRLVAAPFATSRSTAALLLVVLLAAAIQGFREHTLLAQRQGGNEFYARALDQVDLALVVAGVIAAAGLLVGTIEGVLSRRRAAAALTAAGVPRGVLGRALLLEVLVPIVPAALLATAAGILAARGVMGTTVREVVYSATGTELRVTELPVPVPWEALAVIAGGTALATAALTMVALPILRRSADPGELRTA